MHRSRRPPPDVGTPGAPPPDATTPDSTTPDSTTPGLTAPGFTSPRLFVPDALAEGADIPGTPGQAHYLGNVLRREQGAPVRLFNGRDGEFTAKIATLRRDRLVFTVEAQTRKQVAEPDLWLVFSPLKRDATDLVVQKAVELGVSALVPVFCARTNTARVNVDRLAAIAMEAAEQSERLTIPALHAPRPLFDVLADWAPDRLLVAAVERLAAAGPDLRQGTPGGLLVGPEGGFTPRELDVMHATPFIQPVSLGPRILRAETAALAGLALLLIPMPRFLCPGASEPTDVQSW
jgi:16S rRNA (uracil1498-N3)-methyltransferase